MLFKLSHARSSGLSALATRCIDYLANVHPDRWTDVCAEMNQRPHAQHNLSLDADSPAQARELLKRYLADQPAEGLHCCKRLSEARGVVFVYSGQGGQWLGMGRDLYESEPCFRREIDRISEVVQRYAGFSVAQVLLGTGAALETIDVIQPTLFALQVALTKLLESWGLLPAVSIGHSCGEVAAAHCAGGLTLDEAAQIICTRSRLMQTLAGRGQMLFVAVGAHDADKLAARSAGVSVAALNGPRASVLSGDAAVIRALHEELASDGAVFSRIVKVVMASHSDQVEAIRASLLDQLASLSPRPSYRAELYSTVTGGPANELSLDAEHWWRGLRQTVLFAPAVHELVARGFRHFVEIGPHPVVASNILECAGCGVHGVTVLSAMERACESKRWLRDVLVRLHAAGAALVPCAAPQYCSALDMPAAEDAETLALEAHFAAKPTPAPLTLAELLNCAPEQRLRRVQDDICRSLGSLLQWEPESLQLTATVLELGADSLKILTLLEQLSERYGCVIPLADALHSSVDALARRIADALNEEPSPAQKEAFDWGGLVVWPQPGAGDPYKQEPVQLTPLQHAYWLGQQGRAPLSGSAHLFFEREARGLDHERFRRAFLQLLARHEMLRAQVSPDGTWRASPTAAVHAFHLVDLRGQSQVTQQGLLDAVRLQMEEHSPDPKLGPCLRVQAIRLSDEVTRLFFASNLLVIDYTSWRTLETEWQRLYDQPDAELPPLGIGYLDYARAARSVESSEPLLRARAYWEARLATLPAGPALPVLPEAPSAPKWRSRALRLRGADWQALRQRARSLGITDAMLLCGVYSEVIGHWSDSKHFTLNLLSQNRLPLHPQVDQLVARFSGTLLLEVDQRADVSFAERLRQLQAQFLRDYDHRFVCGVDVARRYNQLHHCGGVASFPAVFASVLGTRGTGSVPMAWSGELVQRSLKTPQVLVDNQVYEEAGELVAAWDYVDNGFRPGVVDSMLEAYEQLLRALAADADLWLARRPLIDLGPRAAAAQPVSDTPAAPRCLHSDFVAQAQRTPARAAIIAAQRRLSYAELDRHSDQLALALCRQGARPNTLVAIVMERGWEQIVGALAILKSGAAYLPIDVSLVPSGRVQELLTLGEVSIVLTQPWVERVFDMQHIAVIDVEAENHTSRVDEHVELPACQPHDLAYVMFTSGSTGVPKGVMIEHDAVVNTIDDINRRFGVTAADRSIALASLGFDLSVWDIFGPLSVGGAIVIPEPDARINPARWCQVAEQAGVTVWNSVPKVMELFVEHLAAHARWLPASLRLVMLSGDWIPLSLPAAVSELARDAAPQVVSLGGATEVSIWSIYYRISHIDPDWQSIPYGYSLSGQHVEVFDEQLHRREPWAVGEIHIGGRGLARGYWRSEALTERSFIRAAVGGARWYKTGDLGRYLPDGSIEFLGRKDTQVKVRGYRIELGEIESRIQQHSQVKHCAVTVLTDGARSGAAQIIAYVVLHAGEALESASLNAYLGERLPAYMLPTFVVFMDELPLSANGKLDRKRLPAPESRRSALPPRDDIEQRVLTIWQSVLGFGGFGVTDQFFDLGGDSVQLTRIAGALEREFSVPSLMETLVDSGLLALTVEVCARHLRLPELARVHERALVSIQTRGAGPAFFAVHPVGGSVLCYGRLAALLGEQQPFYGLESTRRDCERAASISEIAGVYIEEIRRVQPHGPYLLGGWSLGGTIAFEMARQLARGGECVPLLAMIDAWAPLGRLAGPSPSERDPMELYEWFCRDLCSLARLDPQRLVDQLRAEPTPSLDTVLAKLRELHALRHEVSDEAAALMFQRYCRNARAGAAFRAASYAGPTLLIRAALRPGPEFVRHPALRNPQLQDPTLGWGHLLTGDLKLCEAPGDHYGVLGPEGIKTTAALLTAAIRAARERMTARDAVA